MKFLERMVQSIKPGQWDTFRAKERLFIEIEKRVGGFPSKHYYHPYARSLDTIVWEREWESFAAFEEAYEKEGADPAFAEAMEIIQTLVDQKREIYDVFSFE